LRRRIDRARTGDRVRAGAITLAAAATVLCGGAALASAESTAQESTSQDSTPAGDQTVTASGSGASGGLGASRGGDGSIRLKAESASPGKVFFYGDHRATYRFTIDGDRSRNLKIQAVNRKTWEVVKVWRRDDLEPGTYRVRWSGSTSKGDPAPKGAYLFRIRTMQGADIDRSRTKGEDRSFKLYPEKFPLRARHTYGDGFGAPRSGHTHQGQDVFARCGKPLVAARGGRIQYSANQAGGAGYYLVVDGKGTRHDYVYMHVQRGGRAHRGERVRTGEQIARVGSTGNASGCHLHFELWSKPGWYEGGHAMRSVTRFLKKWDRWS
jgi:murein DD-endopeptidase MepM/ murein hydrolase activator NlpD